MQISIEGRRIVMSDKMPTSALLYKLLREELRTVVVVLLVLLIYSWVA